MLRFYIPKECRDLDIICICDCSTKMNRKIYIFYSKNSKTKSPLQARVS